MAADRYVALLRGINVGGRNKVLMADLREAFIDAGFEDVSTYIASGNVLFRTPRPSGALEAEIEEALEQRFGLSLVVVVRSHRQLGAVVDEAPADFVASDGTHHRDTVFLKPPLTPDEALGAVQLREGVDRVWAGPGVLYFARLSAERQRSLLSKLAGTAEYQLMTIRSWSTTTKLLALLDA